MHKHENEVMFICNCNSKINNKNSYCQVSQILYSLVISLGLRYNEGLQ